MVKVISYTIRNCSIRKEFAPSGSKFFLLREVSIWKGGQLKRVTACSSSIPLMCVTFSAFRLRHCVIQVSHNGQIWLTFVPSIHFFSFRYKKLDS